MTGLSHQQQLAWLAESLELTSKFLDLALQLPLAKRLLTRRSNSPARTGLVRKSVAPFFTASTAISIVPCAVKMMTARIGPFAADPIQQFHAVHAWHHQVRDHQRELGLAEPFLGRGRRVSDFDFVVLGPQASLKST
jgi:hypothetical protein